ncbi:MULTISPECIES: alpha/beta fold hydrolase [unclassified Bradyrhizobium]|uniref:alpha/beta fold hydrolase n=1 Tax=unclassified Bradyrhizobium TaxID=2631580 RepID=UPI001FFBDB99|nr:alpha/beta fold hydrolase [Bradyrhizobium sp. CW12]MCK1644256.1 alpha/beta fold hydrolase [Bradyrhizobium sp. 154]
MGFISWLFEIFLPQKSQSPTRVEHRVGSGEAAVILLHGFSGDTRATWSGLLDYLLNEPSVATWDVIGLGFPSSLRIDVPNVWTADPDLSIVARSFNTALSLPPLRDYQAIAIVAHSMGGLVAQRAILDSPALAARVGHLLIFGTPSGGLPKARLVSRLKRQFRDMSPRSDFIISLREDWKELYGTETPFDFRAIAGDRDEFVPASSSLVPFRAVEQAVVPGNHLGIVKPPDSKHLSVAIVVDSLRGGHRALPAADSAKLAIEIGRFKQAIETLLPNVGSLDDNALVSLALALESNKRGAEALEILERYHQGGVSSTDAMGTLAGRLKRRWLTNRTASDFARAVELYQAGLEQAETNSDFDQAFYHAINLAFLQLMSLPPFSAITSPCQEMAKRALAHCDKCAVTHWRLATEGEAFLILGDLTKAIEQYGKAIELAGSQREIDSMYSQAFRVSERCHGEAGIKKIEETFGLRR